ncbi:MAG TPA: hypothetical protein VM736_15295, partial [Gemmatimonadales bacterium]|nr:hypothetical protein [Gemmatimonadales bacterium]
DRWPVVREAAASQRRTRRARWGAAGLAAAALVAGLLIGPSLEHRDAEAAELAQAKAESATLEEQLDRYDPDARVMSGRTAALAAALEDRIAMIDGALAQLGPPDAQPRPAELVNLWRQRVDLMQQLVGVRVARTTYIGL